MKRDMDLLRNILFDIEEHQYCNEPLNIEIEDVSKDEIMYHVMLLEDAGLIRALNASSLNDFEWIPMNLTWKGHDFVEAARNDDRWNRAKKIISEKGGGLVFNVLNNLLIKLLNDQVMNLQ